MKTRLFTLLAGCLFLSYWGFAQEVAAVEEADQALPVVTFEEENYDFGTILAGEKVEHVFKFTNTGDAPLVINSAKGSCGCTVPFFPKVPIMPGESSEIEVAFNSQGKQGKQRKSITINANTSPVITVVYIEGEVLPSLESEGAAANDEIAAQRKKEQEAIDAFSPNCFAIYPNPTNESLQLELKEFIGRSATVEIHNQAGQKVMSQQIDHITRESTRFDVSTYNPGIYLISISMEGVKPMTQCFVVTGK